MNEHFHYRGLSMRELDEMIYAQKQAQQRASELLAWYSDPEFPPSVELEFTVQGRKYRGVVHRVDEKKQADAS